MQAGFNQTQRLPQIPSKHSAAHRRLTCQAYIKTNPPNIITATSTSRRPPGSPAPRHQLTLLTPNCCREAGDSLRGPMHQRIQVCKASSCRASSPQTTLAFEKSISGCAAMKRASACRWSGSGLCSRVSTCHLTSLLPHPCPTPHLNPPNVRFRLPLDSPPLAPYSLHPTYICLWPPRIPTTTLRTSSSAHQC